MTDAPAVIVTLPSLADTLGTTTAFTFGATDLWDNGYWIAKTGYNQHSPMARAVFETSATSVSINIYYFGNGAFTPDASTGIQVWVDGLLYATPILTPGVAGAQTIVQALPAGLKIVSITSGVQAIVGGVILGTYLTGCTFNQPAVLLPPQSAGRLVVYSDSRAQGGGGGSSGVNIITAWPSVFRALSTRSITLEAASGRALHDDCVDGTARTAFTAKIAAMSPAAFWIDIGINDYQNASWSAANFGIAYAATIDALHAALPSCRIFCATPMMKHDEPANGLGDTGEAYRQQIRDLIAAAPAGTPTIPRAQWATLVEGTAILGEDDMQSESGLFIHPNDAGNRRYAAAVDTIINGSLPYVLKSPDYGTTEDVTWTNTANATATGSNLAKTGGTGGTFDAAGSSTRKIQAGGVWWVRFTVHSLATSYLFGVSSTGSGTLFTDVLYGFAPAPSNLLFFWQGGGGYSTGYSAILVGDQYQLRSDGTFVYYERIRAGRVTILRKSARQLLDADYPLYVRADLATAASQVDAAKIHGVLA